MKRTRTTVSTIEMREIFIIKNHRRSGWQWCEVCAAQVQVATPDVAAALINEKTRTIYRWVEAERLHFTETADGNLLICLDSLSAQQTPILERLQKALAIIKAITHEGKE